MASPTFRINLLCVHGQTQFLLIKFDDDDANIQTNNRSRNRKTKINHIFVLHTVNPDIFRGISQIPDRV